MTHLDDNERLQNGTLPHDPEDGCVPFGPFADFAWEAPVPFEEQDRPVFPVHALPDAFARFVRDEAEATQTPPDLAGTLVLGALAGSVAGKARVLVKAGYSEPLNLFVVVALPPGERKSAVLADVMQPLEEEERELIERQKPALAAHTANEAANDEAIQRAKERLRKAPDEARRAFENELREAVEKKTAIEAPKRPRLLAACATPERLESLLEEQAGRLIVSSAEGELFDVVAGRYSKHGAPNLEVLLKGHAGDPIRVDRMGRPSICVARPALTLVLAVQPDVIHSLSSQSAFRGRGLLARFLYSLPHSRVGTRDDDAPSVSGYVRLDYASRVRALVAAPLPDKPADLRLSDGARRVLRGFGRDLEPRLHPERGDLASLGDWAAKLTGAVARIAGVLHCAAHAMTPAGWHTPISEETMLSACELGHYFLAHARAAFGEMSATRSESDARAVVQWLRGRGSTAVVSVRDLQRGLSRRFRSVRAAESALVALEERGFARRIPLPAGHGPGRPRSPIFAVHPEVASNATDVTDRKASLS